MGRSADRDQSFTDLVRQVGDPLFRTALLLTGDWQQAEDVVQTSLARLYARGRWAHLDHPLAYLRQMVLNEYLGRRRRRSAGEISVAAVPEQAHGSWDDPSSAMRIDLLRALATLTAVDRAVVVLRYRDGLSVAETATSLGLTESAIRSRCVRVLGRLRSLLTDPLTPDPESDNEQSLRA